MASSSSDTLSFPHSILPSSLRCRVGSSRPSASFPWCNPRSSSWKSIRISSSSSAASASASAEASASASSPSSSSPPTEESSASPPSSASSSPSPSPSPPSSSSSSSSSSGRSILRRPPPVFVLNEKPVRQVVEATGNPGAQEKRLRQEQSRMMAVMMTGEGNPTPSFTTTFRPDHRSGYVALIGKPNVGKSTLMNQIIGQKLSIVTQKPQTTRQRILGICSDESYQMIFYDTPGMIVKRMNKLDEIMMQNVRTAALNADCVLVIADATEAPQKITDLLEDGADNIVQSRPSLLVLNKRDLIKPGEIAKRKQWYEQFSGINEVIAVSAKFGHGVDELKEWIISKIPLGPPYYPKEDMSDQPERFFASEIIREKIFLQYNKEIPYVSQVNILRYVERTAPAKDFVEVEIVVEKESQKAIVIGKEGSALKTLATAARLDIEDFVGRPVYLEVKVKVKEDWRANEGLLKYYGYSM